MFLGPQNDAIFEGEIGFLGNLKKMVSKGYIRYSQIKLLQRFDLGILEGMLIHVSILFLLTKIFVPKETVWQGMIESIAS